MISRACAALASFCVLACAPASPSVPAMSGGIHVNEADHEAWVTALASTGLDSVQVTVYARQLAWDAAEILLPGDAPSVIREIRAAKAQGLRVTLVLRVALEHGLEVNRHYWHGMIWPADVDAWFDRYRAFALWGAALAQQEDVDLLAIGSELTSMTSTTTLTAMPDLYAYFLDPERTASVRERLVDCALEVGAAQLAGELRFVDGGGYDDLDSYLRAQESADRSWTRHITAATDGEVIELEILNRRRHRYEQSWRAIIAAVRQVYDGPLSYAANFDQVDQVGFWDALDSIGVNAYFPLSSWGMSGERLDAALNASWSRVAADLNRLASRHGGPGRVLPVVFFELGWTRKAGSTVRPFSYRLVEALETVGADGGSALTCVHWATQPDDPFERVAALRALDTVVEQGDFPTLRGFTLWKLSTDATHREIEPFVVVLPQPVSNDDSAVAPDDEADRAFLKIAADLAQRLRLSADGGF